MGTVISSNTLALSRFLTIKLPAVPSGGIFALLRRCLAGFPFHSNPERSGSRLRFDHQQGIPAKANKKISKNGTVINLEPVNAYLYFTLI
ncbi:MAG: hypothetical protein B6I30_05420 [Desulfobacteraceae bacterium 4572_187]|nr:MAG: hypothetical protein B6I30_05420 [Desulfobacteraceae bacterium 4572_187]